MNLRACGLALALACSAQAQAADNRQATVNLYIWGEYLAPDTLANFEKSTGIRVVADHFDSLETVETKLLTGRSGYDLVLTAGQHLSRAISSGALQPLDKTRLPHLAGVGEEFRQHMAVFDPGNRYAGTYAWGTTGVGYQQQAVEARLPSAPTDSWAMLFEPEVVSKFASCGVSLLNDPNEVFAAAMRYLGLDINRQRIEDLQQAEALLQKVRPYIRYFDNDRNINDLANGETCLAMSWNGNVAIAQQQAQQASKAVTLNFSIPREGTLIWLDALVIPKDAPHPEAALALMDYLMRPEVIAPITDNIQYANAITAADALVDPAIRSAPATYPPAEVRARLYSKNDNSKAFNRALTRAFSRLKSGT
ncbi:Putrescine-binding periplasmic protein precursor [compost metagenome]|uniref:extracellular solute-binding protein n=1 Tax=Pseudomonas TaxID=286 RepID=UPI00041890C4|nr:MULTISPECIES: extracellular solute-binding protein [Pseudomonas]MCW2272148.1 putative spermidine/putrescine transport system substrate-binding protein/putrescine transport system substrate-binding protein [Pseudomonas sp. JUb96]PRA62394.1 spermidine/putrescine ABC transporter substrate-binding protein [Pseudomonas sp. MYb187]